MTTPETTGDALRRTPLHDAHLALGAKTADFGGWLMPIEYAGQGVLKEHEAVRTTVGLFDVSHLGKASVTGPGAAELVQATLTNDLGRIAPGQAQYTLACDDGTGGVVDDLIVYYRADDDLLLVPNAANTAEVVRRLAAAAPADVQVRDRHTDLAVLAVQGPRARAVLQAVGLPADHDYMSFVEATWQAPDGRDVPVTVCRTGYTGEAGFEMLPPWADAHLLWQALLAAVRDHDGLPCGLGARDTLRTEMGYPLHGHELSLQITPVQARVGWAVGWAKPTFWGREVLARERAAGAARTLRGLVAQGRGVPRADMQVKLDGRVVGTTTSGTFSPTLKQGIALALLETHVAPGTQVEVDVRGRALVCEVVAPPFVPSSVR